jgi:hypothetical protein
METEYIVRSIQFAFTKTTPPLGCALVSASDFDSKNFCLNGQGVAGGEFVCYHQLWARELDVYKPSVKALTSSNKIGLESASKSGASLRLFLSIGLFLQRQFPNVLGLGAPLDRKGYVRVTCLYAGILCGLAIAQIDSSQAFSDGFSRAASPIVALLSVFVISHSLAHVSADRSLMAEIGAGAALTTLMATLGGGLLPNIVQLGLIFVLFVLSFFAAARSYSYVKTGKLRTSFVYVVFVFAQTLLLVAFALKYLR